MADICTDNRFELIDKYKKELIEGTNIETSQDEMAVLDSLLFRFWQMRWLDRLEQPERKKGKWIIKDNPGTGWYRVTCSECGEDVTSQIPMIGFFPNAKALWDYCPNCGTDMRG